MGSKGVYGLTYNRLGREVAAILSLPYDDRRGKAYGIVKATIGAIVGALRRGEEVYLEGFGIFRLRTRKANRGLQHNFYNRKLVGQNVILHPAKTYVHFQPSTVILKALNANRIDGNQEDSL